MNPNNNEHDLSLPQPLLGEQSTDGAPQERLLSAALPEANPATQQMPSLQPPVQASPPPGLPIPNPLPTQPQSATGLVSPVTADDTDLIEKEWVEKAKAIVSGTKDDPFVQSREVGRFKADYMKKRYDKSIKLPEA